MVFIFGVWRLEISVSFCLSGCPRFVVSRVPCTQKFVGAIFFDFHLCSLGPE